ncbi:hypothetical protein [Planctellipticum variicoloris]|uniref:hypothetical protein n=1 Tax=Planctellipticum variicoloris TaxID=3064265 RepID=UPI0030139F0E|nr:hypothetical protein SH412_002709 [Planctomycetaceae bacterium SH412]
MKFRHRVRGDFAPAIREWNRLDVEDQVQDDARSMRSPYYEESGALAPFRDQPDVEAGGQ